MWKLPPDALTEAGVLQLTEANRFKRIIRYTNNGTDVKLLTMTISNYLIVSVMN